MITSHASEQWEKRTPVEDPDPLAIAVSDTVDLESEVEGDFSLYHAEYDILLVVKSWRVVTVLNADHQRMDTTAMKYCDCGCLVDLFEHDQCPRCENTVDRTVTMQGGWS